MDELSEICLFLLQNRFHESVFFIENVALKFSTVVRFAEEKNFREISLLANKFGTYERLAYCVENALICVSRNKSIGTL